MYLGRRWLSHALGGNNGIIEHRTAEGGVISHSRFKIDWPVRASGKRQPSWNHSRTSNSPNLTTHDAPLGFAASQRSGAATLARYHPPGFPRMENNGKMVADDKSGAPGAKVSLLLIVVLCINKQREENCCSHVGCSKTCFVLSPHAVCVK